MKLKWGWFLGILLGSALLAGCESAWPKVLELPEVSQMAEATVSLTQLEKPFDQERVLAGSQTAIESENVDRLEMLDQLDGMVTAMGWSPDSRKIVIVTDLGAYTYDPVTLTRLDFRLGMTDTATFPADFYAQPQWTVGMTSTLPYIMLKQIQDKKVFRKLDWQLPAGYLIAAQTWVSHDGSRLATVNYNLGELLIVQVADGKVLARVEWDGIMTDISFSPDNRYIMVWEFGRWIHIWDFEGEYFTGVFDVGYDRNDGILDAVRGKREVCPSCSPDDRWAAYVNEEEDSKVMLSGCKNSNATDLYHCGDDNFFVRELTGHTGVVVQTVFSGDSRRLATAGEDQTVRVWQVADGKALWTLDPGKSALKSLWFSPDGRYLTALGNDPRVQVWDMETGSRVLDYWLPVNPGGNDVKVIGSVKALYSPDGRWLGIWEVSNDDPDDAEATVLLYPVGGWEQPLDFSQKLRGGLQNVVFSPDASQIVLVDEESFIYTVESQALLYVLKGEMDYDNVVFSPDGKLLAASLWNGDFQLWQTADWKLLRTIETGLGSGIGVEFWRDGKLLVVSGRQFWGILQP